MRYRFKLRVEEGEGKAIAELVLGQCKLDFSFRKSHRRRIPLYVFSKSRGSWRRNRLISSINRKSKSIVIWIGGPQPHPGQISQLFAKESLDITAEVVIFSGFLFPFTPLQQQVLQETVSNWKNL